MNANETPTPARPTALVRWGPVIAGAVIGSAVIGTATITVAILLSLVTSSGGGFTAQTALWTGFWAVQVLLVLAAMADMRRRPLRRNVVPPQMRLGDGQEYAVLRASMSTTRITAPTNVRSGRVDDASKPQSQPSHHRPGW